MDYVIFGLFIAALLVFIIAAGKWRTGDSDIWFGPGPLPEWAKRLAEKDREKREKRARRK